MNQKETATDPQDQESIPKNQRQCHRQANMYRTLLASSFDRLYMFDTDLRLIYANPAQLGLWATTLEMSEGKSFDEIGRNIEGLEPSKITALIANFERALSGETVRTTTQHQSHRQTQAIESVISPVYDDAGQIVGVCGATRDVSQQMLDQSALAGEKRKLEAVFEESPAAMALWRGPDLVFEMVNPEYQRIFGNRELLNKPLLEALPELKGQTFIDEMTRVWETGIPYTAHEALAKLAPYRGGPTKDHYFDLSYIQIKDSSGKPYGIYNHAVDVTDKVLSRRRLEESKHQLSRSQIAAEEANAAKRSFLANMSHEIRTPLGVIIGFSELIKEKKLKPQEREHYIDAIIRNGKALTRIIDDILDLAKIESGHLQIETVAFSLYDVISDAVEMFRDQVRQKSIYLFLNIEEAVPDRICSDPTRLRQILVNLVSNAVKFTTEGGVRISVTSTDKGDNPHHIAIEVKDTGIGLTTEQAEKLFRPFVQGDNTTTRKFGGTGLGLALSRRLAEALGGKIEITDCAQNKGCTISLNIPVRVPHDTDISPSHAERSATVSGKTPLKNIAILVVDDSKDNQLLIRHLLMRSGANVDLASDGSEGVAKAMSGNYDIILMDIQMPIMDGYQAKQRLDEKGYDKPVIALTAHAMLDERVKTQAAGFARHLTKPLITQELVQVTADVVRT